MPAKASATPSPGAGAGAAAAGGGEARRRRRRRHHGLRRPLQRAQLVVERVARRARCARHRQGLLGDRVLGAVERDGVRRDQVHVRHEALAVPVDVALEPRLDRREVHRLGDLRLVQRERLRRDGPDEGPAPGPRVHGVQALLPQQLRELDVGLVLRVGARALALRDGPVVGRRLGALLLGLLALGLRLVVVGAAPQFREVELDGARAFLRFLLRPEAQCELLGARRLASVVQRHVQHEGVVVGLERDARPPRHPVDLVRTVHERDRDDLAPVDQPPRQPSHEELGRPARLLDVALLLQGPPERLELPLVLVLGLALQQVLLEVRLEVLQVVVGLDGRPPPVRPALPPLVLVPRLLRLGGVVAAGRGVGPPRAAAHEAAPQVLERVVLHVRPVVAAARQRVPLPPRDRVDALVVGLLDGLARRLVDHVAPPQLPQRRPGERERVAAAARVAGALEPQHGVLRFLQDRVAEPARQVRRREAQLLVHAHRGAERRVRLRAAPPGRRAQVPEGRRGARVAPGARLEVLGARVRSALHLEELAARRRDARRPAQELRPPQPEVLQPLERRRRRLVGAHVLGREAQRHVVGPDRLGPVRPEVLALDALQRLAVHVAHALGDLGRRALHQRERRGRRREERAPEVGRRERRVLDVALGRRALGQQRARDVERGERLLERRVPLRPGRRHLDARLALAERRDDVLPQRPAGPRHLRGLAEVLAQPRPEAQQEVARRVREDRPPLQVRDADQELAAGLRQVPEQRRRRLHP